MTTYTGLNPGSFHRQNGDPDYFSSNLADQFLTHDFSHKEIVPNIAINTTSTNNTPIDLQPHATDPALRVLSYFDIFYNRIHVTPSRLELGNLLSAQSRVVELFNANFFEVNVTDFEVTGTSDGITVTTPQDTPFVLAPLQAVNYVFGVSLSGPPTVSAAYRWTIEGLTYDLTVSGNRVLVFPFEANWADDIIEKLSWSTHIHEPYSRRAEYRYGRTSLPRQTFDMSYMLQREDPSRLRNLFLGWQSRLYAVPDWTSQTFITANSEDGTFTVEADVSFGNFEPGRIAILYGNKDVYEALEIESIVGTTVTFTSSLINRWTKGMRLLPGNLCGLLIDQSIIDKNEGVVTAKLSWSVDPVEGSPWLPIGDIPTTYAGKESWMTEPNWRDDLTTKVAFRTAKLDNTYGAINLAQTGAFEKIVYPHAAYLNRRPAIANFRAFLGRRQGKLNDFFYPSFRRDFDLIGDLTNAATGFQAKASFDPTLMRSLGTHNYVTFLLTNGTVLTYPITGASNSSFNVMDITIAGSFPRTIPYFEVKRVSYFHLARLDTDEIQITWKTPYFAEADFTVTPLVSL